MNLMAMSEKERLDPSVLQRKISRPIFIVGLNRSGTTFLQNLLSNHFRSVHYLEMVCPYGDNGKLNISGKKNSEYDWDKDPRLPTAQDVLDAQLGQNDQWLGIHNQKASGPEEEFLIMEHIGRSYSFMAMADAPNYREWLYSNDFQELSLLPSDFKLIQLEPRGFSR